MFAVEDYVNVAFELSGNEIDLPSLNDARVFREDQVNQWLGLMGSIENSLNLLPMPSIQKSRCNNLLVLMRRVFASRGLNYFGIEKSQSGATVRSSLPILPEKQLSLSKLSNENPLAALAVIYFEISDLIFRAFDEEGVREEDLRVLTETPLLQAQCFYAAAKTSLTHRIKSEELRLTSTLRDLLNSMRTEVDEMIGAAKLRQDELERVREANSEMLRAADLRLEEHILAAKHEITAFKHSAFEREMLKAATETWTIKALWHGIAFLSGMAGLFLFFSISLYVGFENAGKLKQLYDALKNNNGDIPYGIIVFFLVPSIAIGWFLRIYGRWIVSSMALRADAQHRLALLSTYFQLVADPANNMGQGERGIVLAAVFRPLPGQEGNEDINPPSILDLFKGKEK